MRGVRTGDMACRFPECRNRVKRRGYCDDCRRVMAEQVAATNSVLFPPSRPYTPRVISVLKPGR